MGLHHHVLVYIKVYNTLSIFASLCHILPPSCSTGFFRRCCGRFTWLTGNRARNPAFGGAKETKHLAFLTTILQELYLTVSQNINNFRNICFFFYPIFKFKCKDNSVQSQATKTRSSVPSKHTFKARPSATGASPPWRHISIYIYMAGSKGKSQARNFLGTLSMLSPS